MKWFGPQVQVKDAFARSIGGIAVTLKAKTVGKTQEKRELDPIKSTTNYNDGVASFVVNIPSDVTTLKFNVSWILICCIFKCRLSPYHSEDTGKIREILCINIVNNFETFDLKAQAIKYNVLNIP